LKDVILPVDAHRKKAQEQRLYVSMTVLKEKTIESSLPLCGVKTSISEITEKKVEIQGIHLFLSAKGHFFIDY